MIDGVCVTGGEPCLQPGLPEFLARIKDIGLKVKLDTNGSEPDMLSFVLSGGFVDYVAMDIKHSFEKYGEVVKRHDWREVSVSVSRSMDIIRSAGVEHEYRTTVWKGVHTEEDISDIASLMKEGEKYFLQDLRAEKTLLPIEDKDGLRAGAIAAAIAERHPGIVISARN
jgi:pyruvate formate lyase activating enzyme